MSILQIKIAHSTRCAVTERFHGERVAYSVFVKELKAHYPDTVTNEYVGSALDALRREGSFNSSMDGRYSISAAEQRTIELKVQAIISDAGSRPWVSQRDTHEIRNHFIAFVLVSVLWAVITYRERQSF